MIEKMCTLGTGFFDNKHRIQKTEYRSQEIEENFKKEGLGFGGFFQVRLIPQM